MSLNKRFISLISILIALTLATFFLLPNFDSGEFLIKENEAQEVVPPEVSEKKAPEYPFKPGEKLHYGIYSTGIKVGRATITYMGTQQVEGRWVSYVKLEASAPGFYDLEKIYGEVESSSPIRIERQIRMFGKDIKILEEYDQKNKRVLITRTSGTTETTAIKSEEDINNIILLLYQFRQRRDYGIGDKLRFNLPTKELEIVVDKEMLLKVPQGSYQSIYIRSIPANFKVWFKKDNDRIPLRIQGAIGFGNTYLSLLEVEQP